MPKLYRLAAVALMLLIAACTPDAPAEPVIPQPAAALPEPALPADPAPETAAAEPAAIEPAAVGPEAVETEAAGPQAGEAGQASFVLFDPEAGMLRSFNLDGSLRFEASAPGLSYPMAETMTVLKDAVYYASEGPERTIYRASAAGTQMLELSIGGLSGFKVSPDEQWIAWSVLDMAAAPPSSKLWINSLEGPIRKENAQEIASLNMGMGQPLALLPIRWAEDSSRLFFERSKTGLGGYILFNGRFSLYSYDLAGGQITTHFAAEQERGACLDSFRLDLDKIVFSCDGPTSQVSILDLTTGQESQAPLLPEQGAAGSSQLSPSGQWLAYATARRSPDDEAGQVAVVPADFSADPVVIFKVGQQRYLTVQGWLDEDTLLLTANNFSGPPNTVMTIRRDGSDAREIAAGQFAGWAR